MAGNINVQAPGGSGATDLASYIEKLRQAANDTNKKMLEDAKAQTDVAKEQIKLVNEQIEVLTRKNALEARAAQHLNEERRNDKLAAVDKRQQRMVESIEAGRASGKYTNKEADAKIKMAGTNADKSRQKIEKQAVEQSKQISSGAAENDMLVRIMRENMEAVRNASEQQIAQMARGDDSIVQALDDKQAELNQLSNRAATEQNNEGKFEKRYAFFKEHVFDQVTKGVSTLTNSENGYDTIKDGYETGGKVVGGALGAVAGYFMGDIKGGAEIGAEIGGGIMGAVGEMKQKQAIYQQDLLAETNKFSALGGNSEAVVVPDLSKVGIDRIGVAQLMTEVAKHTGTVANAGKNAADMVYANKAYGVENENYYKLLDIQGSNPENKQNAAALLAGIMARGVDSGIFKKNDYAGLNDFLGKFSTLQQSFLQAQTNVSTGVTMDIMSRFNSVGGEFAVGDSRSMGNIAAVQDGLTHPGSDSMKALSFLTLRKLNPGAGMFDIMEMQEQGLSGEHGMEYLQKMLQYSHNASGSADYNKMVLKNMFPNLSASAVRNLYDKYDGSKPIKREDYLEATSLEVNAPKEAAEANTTTKERNAAEAKDALLKSTAEAMEKMGELSANAIKETLSGATIELKDGVLTVPARGGGSIAKGSGATTPEAYKNKQ